MDRREIKEREEAIREVEAYIRRWVRQTVRDAFVITVGLVLFVFVVTLLLAKLICSIC